MNNTNEYLMAEARKELASRAGKACAKKHGNEFYKEISRKGVEARKAKKDKITTQ